MKQRRSDGVFCKEINYLKDKTLVDVLACCKGKLINFRVRSVTPPRPTTLLSVSPSTETKLK